MFVGSTIASTVIGLVISIESNHTITIFIIVTFFELDLVLRGLRIPRYRPSDMKHMCIMEEEQLSTSQDTHTLQMRQSNGQWPIEKKINILKINMNKHIKYNYKADMLDVLSMGVFVHKFLIYLIGNILILMKAKYPTRRLRKLPPLFPKKKSSCLIIENLRPHKANFYL